MMLMIAQERAEAKKALEEKEEKERRAALPKKTYFKWVKVAAQREDDGAISSDDEEAYVNPPGGQSVDEGASVAIDGTKGQQKVRDPEFDAVDLAMLNQIKNARASGTTFQGQQATAHRRVDPDFAPPAIPSTSRVDVYNGPDQGISASSLGDSFLQQLAGIDEYAYNSDSNIVCNALVDEKLKQKIWRGGVHRSGLHGPED